MTCIDSCFYFLLGSRSRIRSPAVRAAFLINNFIFLIHNKLILTEERAILSM